ncbi:MAG: polysaccharide deacetylase family protein [Pseudomonadota bacterium]
MRLAFAACAACFIATGCASTPVDAPSDRRIAISFDDAPLGPGPRGDWDRAGTLITALEAAETEAVFFATTRGFVTRADGRERVERYGLAGHVIANHTHTHPWLYKTDADVYLADIDEAERQLEGIPNRRDWFRFPFLDRGRRDTDKRAAVRQGLIERGLGDGYVTVDTYDWHLDSRWRSAMRDGQAVEERALEKVYVAMVVDASEKAYDLADAWLGEQPVHVLLLHENDSAASFVGPAIEALREAGWTIVTPDEAYANRLSQPDVSVGFTGAGRVAALAWEAGARGAETFDHWSASEDGINQRLADEGVIALPKE